MPPPEGHNTNPSNIRVFVHWQDQVVFAGEEVKCTITFKNVAPVPGNGSSSPSPPHPSSGLPSSSSSKPPSRHPSGERRNKANAVGLAPPPPTRGHRSTLSLTGAPSASAASRSRAGSIPWSPPPIDTNGNGHGHKRSVSIVSIGSANTVEGVGGGGGQNNGGASGKAQRPGRGHARASSLQIVPRASPMNGPRSGEF